MCFRTDDMADRIAELTEQNKQLTAQNKQSTQALENLKQAFGKEKVEAITQASKRSKSLERPPNTLQSKRESIYNHIR